jgi:hypothetical protein
MVWLVGFVIWRGEVVGFVFGMWLDGVGVLLLRKVTGMLRLL